MKNLIVMAAVAAATASASAQDFPFNTFDGQVNDAPFSGMIETPVLDPYGVPYSVHFLDVDGDGRFDYMGAGTGVVDLDGYHDSLDWTQTTNPSH